MDNNDIPAVPPDQKQSSLANKRKNRVIERRPLIAHENVTTPQKEPQVETPALIIDSKLEDQDLRIEINVRIVGRTLLVMDCPFTSAVYGARMHQQRGVLLQTLERLLEDIRLTVALKADATIGESKPGKASKKGNGGFTEKVPFYTGEEEVPSDLKIHPQPDAGLSTPESN